MDEVKTTPPKARTPKSKKLLIVILALLLAGAVGGSYYWRNRDQEKPVTHSDDTSQTQTSTADEFEQQIDDIKERYEKTKAELADVASKDQNQQMILYTSAAIDGAQLNDPQAKEFATKALALMPESERSKAPNQQIADFISRLVEISKGNFEPAQELLDAAGAQ